MNARVATFALLFVGLVFGYFLYERHAQRETIARLEQHIITLEGALPSAEVRLARDALSDLAPAADALPVREPLADRDAGATAQPSAVTEAEATHVEIEPEAMHEDVSTQFATEHQDGWSEQARSTVTAKMTALLPRAAQLRSVECRETMCRIETTHETSRTSRAFARGFFLSAAARPWNGAMFAAPVTEPTAGGPVVAVYYLMRPGYEIPSRLVEP